MATIKDVAALATVSVGTVSNYINGSKYVRPETATRIREAMEKLSYRPNGLARGLRRQSTSTIGLVVPDSANPFFAEVAWRIEQAAAAMGFGTMLCNTGGLPQFETSSLNLLAEKRVDGIIIVSNGSDARPLKETVGAGIPLVQIVREVPGIESDVLVADNFRGGSLVASHLLELGHKEMGYVGREPAISPSRSRLEGFRSTLETAGIDMHSGYVVSACSLPEDGYRATISLLERYPEITAIFAYNDITAFGVIRAAFDCGYPVPDRLSVVGFDNISMADLSVPRLTTVSTAGSLAELGRVAVVMIAERLTNPDHPPKHHVLPVHLVVRESTAPLAARKTQA